MDVKVKASNEGDSWQLVDLLGRSMGAVVCTGSVFTIIPDGHALETMHTMIRGPFRTLDAALAAIERHTRGTCRLEQTNAIVPVNDK